MVSETRWVGQCLVVAGLSLALGACGNTKSDSKDGAGGDGTSTDPDGPMTAPAARGAGVFSLRPLNPLPPGKACPVLELTSSIPTAAGPDMLDGDTYLHHIVDGEGAATLSCKVSGNLRFTFEGSLQLGPLALEIQNGVLGDDRLGTADITVANAQDLSGSLTSAGPCSIDAMSSAGQNFQVTEGSIWAGFECPSVERPPSESCAASGVFVLENCEP
jgi:hypothetical protein